MIEKGTFFQLILFENGATKAEQRRCIKSIQKQNYAQMQYVILSKEETNREYIKSRLTGDYVLFMSMKDYLADGAIAQFAKKVKEVPTAQWIYGDEEILDTEHNNASVSHHKPAWSKETFLSFFYTGDGAVYKTELCHKINDWNLQDATYRNYDFALHFLEICKEELICHIPAIVLHGNKKGIGQESEEYLRSIKEEYLKRNGIDGRVEKEPRTGEYRVVYDARGKVSIVIPSKDNPEILLKGIASIEGNTTYKDYEIIVVDNGSCPENKAHLEKILAEKQIGYLYEPMEFNFSAMCNLGARATDGEYILFLNDDMECVQPDWLNRMVGQGMQKGIGAVGAKLLYPQENRIQHIGVVNVGQEMGPAHVLSKRKDEGVLAFGRNCLDYNYDAVTAACLLVKRSIYNELQGFCEELPVSYNDVDFCYRLREAGYRNVVRTDAVLLHHESLSRGLDSGDEKKMLRLKKEREYLYSRHRWIVEDGDSSYNPNYTTERNDFSLAIYDVPAGDSHRCKGKWYINKPFQLMLDSTGDEKAGRIAGWFYFRNDRYTNRSDIYLVFRNVETKEEIWYETYKQARPDVADILKNQGINCGWVCNIPNEEIKKLHGFKIGLCIRLYNFRINLMSWTDVVLE